MALNEFIISLGSATIIILIGIISYLIKKDFNKIDTRIEKKRDKETCDIIHKNTDGRLNKIDGKIDILLLKKVADTGSPRKFTAYGKTLLKYTGIKKVLDDIIPDFCKLIDQSKPKNYFQVEVKADKLLDKVKQNKFIRPKLEKIAKDANTSIDILLFVGAVYLSTKYLEQHPKLTKEK